jgi:hypothetical protein
MTEVNLDIHGSVTTESGRRQGGDDATLDCIEP